MCSKFFGTNPKGFNSVTKKKFCEQSACNTTALYRKFFKYGIYKKVFALCSVNFLSKVIRQRTDSVIGHFDTPAALSQLLVE